MRIQIAWSDPGARSIGHTVPARVPVGWVAAATATAEPAGATSEFSPCVPFAGLPPLGFDAVIQSAFPGATTPAGIAFTNAVLARFGR